MTSTPRVTVWNEGRHEKLDAAIGKIYPEGIHGAIATGLRAKGLTVRTATLEEPEHGLTEDVLNQTMCFYGGATWPIMRSMMPLLSAFTSVYWLAWA